MMSGGIAVGSLCTVLATSTVGTLAPHVGANHTTGQGRVVAPTPPCVQPDTIRFVATPLAVKAGAEVQLSVHSIIRCGAIRERTFVIRATPVSAKNAEPVGSVETAAEAESSASIVVRPQVTTRYTAAEVGQAYTQPPQQVVTVIGSRKSCDGQVTLNDPPLTALGGVASLSGRAPSRSEVQVWFRRRGQQSFQARRTLMTDDQGRISASYVANDDYRYYAVSGGCRSNIGLSQVVR